MKCIICHENMGLYIQKSFLTLPVFNCSNCNFHITGETPQQRHEFSKKIYESKHWGENNIWDAKTSINSDYNDTESQGKKRDWISQLKYCKPYLKNNIEVLEIGSGQGQAVYWFEKEGFRVTGVEPDKNNVELINNKLKSGKCIVSLAEEFETNQSYDLIWMSHVLEHLVEPDLFLRKIKNNLKKEGIFFIEVPNCENKKMLNISINKVPHTFHFSKKSLEGIAKNEKYKVIKVDYFRPATKLEGILNKIKNNQQKYQYYPRILTDKEHGKVLRIILRNN